MFETKTVPEKLTFSEKIPSNWDIKADGEDSIIATNNSTGREFKGTVSDFSKLLKA